MPKESMLLTLARACRRRSLTRFVRFVLPILVAELPQLGGEYLIEARALSEAVREQSLAVLDHGGDLQRWQAMGPGVVRERAAVATPIAVDDVCHARQARRGPVRQRSARPGH